ncbi:transcriptional regulator [Xenorhabdus mauleonii]|uniref:HTH domain-containing protein n=1 Tax=Xenorhabdus mauleonii TaxID=351675 RepID=A0A1I3KLX5_9GAMM|nr:HTH domain-containing protein [Xenorhabdus mauleonii]PHM45092.1 transcriptional regulator [Xenorhabdus mauleonii]SFI73486.1 HTH domain-containing protein [Xenorhabdus mauleonii]
MKTQHDHYNYLSVRLSFIISRLLAGEYLALKTLADEFGVSERTLQRDFQNHLIHLDLEHFSGSYRLTRRTGWEHLLNTFAFICNSGMSGIIPAQNRRLMD